MKKTAKPQTPISMNADMMTQDELYKKLQNGLRDAEEVHVHDAEEVFARFRVSKCCALRTL